MKEAYSKFIIFAGRAMSGKISIVYSTGYKTASSCYWVVPGTMEAFENLAFVNN